MDNTKTLLQIKICKRHSQFFFSTVRANASTSAVFILDLLSRKLDITIADAKFHSLIIVFKCINRNINILKTLESHECLLDVQQQMIKKYKPNNNSNNDPNNDNNEYDYEIKWFFKDSRTEPLQMTEEFTGYLSGDEESEDENDCAHADLSYVKRNASCSGYIYKRSEKDINLYRKRSYAITDKLWCYYNFNDNENDNNYDIKFGIMKKHIDFNSI
jgi:hypothetical protein